MPADRTDPALDALFLPFVQAALDWPQAPADDAPQALFLRARAGEALTARAGVLAAQSFRPEADRLTRTGIPVVAAPSYAGPVSPSQSHSPPIAPRRDARIPPPAAFPLVLVLPPRQREEARGLFACAVRACLPGGVVVAAQANDEGAKSGEADLARLTGLSGSLSKHRCRAYWSRLDPARVDRALLQEWADADMPRRIDDARFPGGGFLSRPGVFSWDRVDAASVLLAEHLPSTLGGRVADLGAGIGYLSAVLLQRCAGLSALDLYEAEARALDLARANLAAIAPAATPAPQLGFHWHDVAAGLPGTDYDAIVSNPPFHALGRGDRNDLGLAFIAGAADALRRGGRLWLVANRHLPYEDILRTRFSSMRAVAQQAGFKVLEAIR